MHRFAYPNFIPQKSGSQFIGCGRYKAMRPDLAGAGDIPVKDGPETPDLSQLRRALETLAPESYDSAKIVFETKDRPDQTYRGNSADLAYLLAHINRARPLIFPDKKYTGDVWCTGIVKFREASQSAVLSEVDRKGFRIKLDAFLSPENRDALFIAPTANVDDTEIDQIIKDHQVELIALKQFKASGQNHRLERKTIIKVLSNEVPELIDLFFDRSRSNESTRIPKKRRFAYLLGLLALLALLFAGWNYYQQLPARVTEALENGEFKNAAALMENKFFENPQLNQLKQMLDKPLQLTLKIEYRPVDEPEAPILRQDVAEIQHLTLSHNHLYRLWVNAAATSWPLYVYIYQEDWRGKVDRLFPNPVWNPGQHNPLRAPEFPCYVPASANGWYYMDALPVSDKNQTKLETVYVIASPWRARDIETAYGAIQEQTDPVIRKEKLARFVKRLELRRNSGFKSFYLGVFAFRHGG